MANRGSAGLRMRAIQFAWWMLLCAAAQAQIRLPTLPGAPLQTLTSTWNQAAAGIQNQLNDLRHEEIRRLVMANRRTIEMDPNGDPIVRREIIALFVTEEALTKALARGFSVDRAQPIAWANSRLLVLNPPARESTSQALTELRAADSSGVYDYNHLFNHSGAVEPPSLLPGAATPPPPPVPSARPTRRIGLLDTGVDLTHPAFSGSSVQTWGCGGALLPNAHGTAVASLLVAHAPADLYAADVYCGTPTGGAADAIVAALEWLLEERVAVINISLVGPENRLLEQIIERLIERGHVIVAAVGNDGPAAPPLYPAAYAKVVGVTAVDAKQRVLLEAERGPQVMFAAPGADIRAADLGHRYSTVRGTSFAAPTVAALLAGTVSSPDPDVAQAAIELLAKQAVHLGAPGKDLTYGFGLVGVDIH